MCPLQKNSQSQKAKLTSWVSNHTPQAASSAEEKQNHAWRKTEEITQIVSKEWIWNVFDLAQALFFLSTQGFQAFTSIYCISRGCSLKEVKLNNTLHFPVMLNSLWAKPGPRWGSWFASKQPGHLQETQGKRGHECEVPVRCGGSLLC